MVDIHNLTSRIDAEFAYAAQKSKDLQALQLRSHHERKNRHEIVKARLSQLRDEWQPRLNALVHSFPHQADVASVATELGWEDTLKLQSDLARVQVKMSASADADARRLCLEYHLEVLPIFLDFVPRTRLEFPYDAVDHRSAGNWLDDRIIDFVRLVLSLQQHNEYLRGHLVEDPIAHVWFPKHSAGATLDRNGQTYYFIAEETRREFESHDCEPSSHDGDAPLERASTLPA